VLLNSLESIYNDNSYFNHFPNNIFLRDLTNGLESQIFVKWKTTNPYEKSALRSVSKKYDVEFANEFHLKSISIDGVDPQHSSYCQNPSPSLVNSSLPILITGSANKDNMTMLGGFREFQVALFKDKKNSAIHDCIFWQRWNDRNESQIADPLDFRLPSQVSTHVNQTGFLEIMRDMFLSIYTFQEAFFQ
jgi:hypothetical protein